MQDFSIDPRIERDSVAIADLGLCQLRLMRDARWPWLLAIPQRQGIAEMFELAPLDQTMLTFEVNEAAKALSSVTGAEKINVAAIGNIVRQLHVHIVARFEGDANWPGPIWGYGAPVPRSEEDIKALALKIAEAMAHA